MNFDRLRILLPTLVTPASQQNMVNIPVSAVTGGCDRYHELGMFRNPAQGTGREFGELKLEEDKRDQIAGLAIYRVGKQPT